MRFNIDVNIKRISNGYIVTGIDSTKTETFYKSLPELMDSLTMDEARESHEDLIRSDSDAYEFNLVIKTTEKG